MRIAHRLFVLAWLASMILVTPLGFASFADQRFLSLFFASAIMCLMPVFLAFGCWIFTGSTNQVIDFLANDSK